jgi:dihydropteroate synthase
MIEPLGLLDGPEAYDAVACGMALPLAGGPIAFTLARVIPSGEIVHAVDSKDAQRLAACLPAWAGVPRPAVMGIINVTPDSFSDGGVFLDDAVAVQAARRMAADGADIIDIGGESTRPNSRPVSAREEQARILPVIRALADLRISVDTRNASTMAAALDCGACIVNDVSALSHDPDALKLVAERHCPVVLMHMRGEPSTMGNFARYGDVAIEVVQELAVRVAAAQEAGIRLSDIAVDPGLGFAKTGQHNLEILRRLTLLCNLGCPIVVGASRKRFIGGETRNRLPGSLAAALEAVGRGAAIIRVHDVPETVQALSIRQGLSRDRRGS